MKKIIFLLLFLGFCQIAHATDYCDSDAVGCWKMVDSTTESDESGNGADLTVSSGDTIEAVDGGRDFEASDGDYLYDADGGSTDISGTTGFSVTFWVFPESMAGGETVISKYTLTGNQMQFLVHINDANGQIQTCLSSNGQATGRTCTNTDTTYIADDDWSHVAVVYDYDGEDNYISIYINGVLENTPTSHASGIYNGSAEFLIGARGDVSDPPTNHYDGIIGEVGLFDRALSSTEVNDIMDCGLDGTWCEEPEPTGRRVIYVL